MDTDLDTVYKLVAGSGDYERFLEFLHVVHNHAADIREWDRDSAQETRSEFVAELLGRVDMLAHMIDKLQSARKNLNQQSRPLETEHD